MSYYASQLQVEGYLGRSLTDEEMAYFPTLESGVADYIDVYCGRTFSIARGNTSSIDTTVGDGSSNPFQRFDGGDQEIFFDQPLQTDTTAKLADGVTSAGVFTPYIGFYDLSTGNWQLADPSTYTYYPRNSKAKTSVETVVGVFGYGINNCFVYGIFCDYIVPPAGIQLAASTLCANILNMTDDLKSETIEGYARVMDTDFNPIVDRLLANYRRVVL